MDKPVKNSLSSLWWPKRVCIAIAGIPLAFSIALFADWQYDNFIIGRQAAEIVASSTTDSARIVAVNHWVYNHQGFGKNLSYFLVPALGPTPIQVMERGGDCSDKSRLVAAMLNELGIEAGLVMISPCLHCEFIHTVVEAHYEGGSMVVDPIWNVDYPTGDGRYFGVRDLAWTNRGEQRVVELQRERGEADKIAKMPVTEARFEYAVAVNWDKNVVTRISAEIMRLLDYEPKSMYRPRLLEDPKLALFWFFVLVTMAATAASVLLYGIYRALLPKGGRDNRNHREIAMS
jgi:hypothetical protein